MTVGTGGVKPRLRRHAPRTVWRLLRAWYWSGFANLLRKIAAEYTVFRRRKDVDGLNTVLLFIGYPRSGHSLVGSLLSAHPEVVVAHELHALWYRERGFTLRQIVGLMLRRDLWFERHDRQWTEYNYSVPGQWQGRYRMLTVIGDKKGDGVTDLTHRYPGLLCGFLREVRNTGAELKVIHTVRNPFDNIATMQRRTGDDPDYVIERHMKRLAVNSALISVLPPGTVYTVRHEDLIGRPEDELSALLRYLDLAVPEGYLEACSGILYTAPHRSRDGMDWSPTQREVVERMIARTPFLGGYSFDD